MARCIDDLIIDKTYPSPHFNQRIFCLVFHYTALNFEKSLRVLTDPKTQVSAHYLVPEASIDKARKVFQLVKEEARAWHAGVSYWQKRTNLNDISVGIEMVNLGYEDDDTGKRTWFSFTDYQIESVVALAKNIIQRYEIHPTCIIGHSDIAPGRKVDPGPLFPWKKLYTQGVGAWFDEKAVKKIIEKNDSNKIDIEELQRNLFIYGYDIEITGMLDKHTTTILQTFQMHFRPNDYSGNPDAETAAILENLIEKYFLIKEK
jgi:N-acetylmuramoyl-L-alanine amidase